MKGLNKILGIVGSVAVFFAGVFLLKNEAYAGWSLMIGGLILFWSQLGK